MSTITAILEADVDGTVHVPLPEELRGAKIKITATIEPAEPDPEERSLRLKRAMEALRWLQKRGTFRGIDAVAWQREIRKDRPLPGRE